jgi:hypothetical protein
MASMETRGRIFQGFCPEVWLLVMLHAAGGILVALSVLYSSSVAKAVAVSGALVATTTCGHFLFGAALDFCIGMGCVITIIAIFNYRDDSDVEARLEEADAALATGAPGECSA